MLGGAECKEESVKVYVPKGAAERWCLLVSVGASACWCGSSAEC